MLFSRYAPRDQKLPTLQRASSSLDALKCFLQLAWEMDILENKPYLAISQPLAEVGKMLGGWQKQLGIP